MNITQKHVDDLQDLLADAIPEKAERTKAALLAVEKDKQYNEEQQTLNVMFTTLLTSALDWIWYGN